MCQAGSIAKKRNPPRNQGIRWTYFHEMSWSIMKLLASNQGGHTLDRPRMPRSLLVSSTKLKLSPSYQVSMGIVVIVINGTLCDLEILEHESSIYLSWRFFSIPRRSLKIDLLPSPEACNHGYLMPW